MTPAGLLLCAANFSEGRRAEVVGRIARATEIEGVRVLDLHTDPDHNRSVLTVAGRTKPLVEALIAATAEAAELIDLRGHRGVHPRLGAMDVIPFTPHLETEMGAAASAARSCAERIWTELSIPCFLYEAAARPGNPSDLPSIRRGAFGSVFPDFGAAEPHPSAGATVVGARGPLVAFNVNLATTDIVVANRIARSLREREGGLPHVRTLALELESRGIVQISMNLTRPAETTIGDAYAALAAAAAEEGVARLDSELVGLAPRAALGGRGEGLGFARAPKVLEEELAAAFPI